MSGRTQEGKCQLLTYWTLVQKLQGRIDSHGPMFRQNEALTRYALVDPLLRALGWDTENPTVVIPEFSTGEGRADYALLTDAESPTRRDG